VQGIVGRCNIIPRCRPLFGRRDLGIRVAGNRAHCWHEAMWMLGNTALRAIENVRAALEDCAPDDLTAVDWEEAGERARWWGYCRLACRHELRQLHVPDLTELLDDLENEAREALERLTPQQRASAVELDPCPGFRGNQRYLLETLYERSGRMPFWEVVRAMYGGRGKNRRNAEALRKLYGRLNEKLALLGSAHPLYRCLIEREIGPGKDDLILSRPR
jgi:hypothetical protein